MTLDDADSLVSLGALSDNLRRGMYDFIRRARRPVTRDEAAASVGISRKLAAFHLDKLVDAGLLQARYEAPGGVRRVGRTPKVYEPVAQGIEVSIPARRYAMLAELLADAVAEQADGESAHQAALRVAAERGESAGAAERARSRPGRLGAERALTLAAAALEEYGFEPERCAPTLVRLRNCPFHRPALRQPELVCGVNQAFLAGYLRGLGSDRTAAVLAPRPGACCVELRAGAPGEPGAPGELGEPGVDAPTVCEREGQGPQ